MELLADIDPATQLDESVLLNLFVGEKAVRSPETFAPHYASDSLRYSSPKLNIIVQMFEQRKNYGLNLENGTSERF
jgi:hypothetical protein